MISKIEELEFSEKKLYGTMIDKLYQVSKHDLSIVDSFVITNNIFKEFLHNKNILQSGILNFDEFTNRLRKYDSISIYPSFNKEIYGIESFQNIKPTQKSIIDSIQKIYNAWLSDNAKAFRIVYSINDPDSFPAILIQPFFSECNSLVTRCPRFGKTTNNDNLLTNIHNTIPALKINHEIMIDSIEGIFKTPIKFYFVEQSNQLKIIKIEDEIMTLEAKGSALNDLYNKSVLDVFEYIMRLESSMVYKHNGFTVTPVYNKDLTRIKGLPASPGMTKGKLIINYKKKSIFENSIFCCIDTSPEDLNMMVNFDAIIASRGGMTCHAAVVARGLNKPSVVSLPFTIDYKTNCLICGNKKFQEGVYVCVDGNQGHVYFSNHPLFLENNYEASTSINFLIQAYSIVKSVGNKEDFGKLPLDIQFKVAELMSAFNKIHFKI
ncbi:Pyruvate phosphate dikinase [termite gut metagenome]|uniref:Pyruvate phosphate dikinase n=1 Tax=termite gut metagenome TaxID=433724 RepID=A0A5J4SKM0_9ZZZZ